MIDFIFTPEHYTRIRKFCSRFIFKHHYHRHFEDMVQHIAMEFFRKKGKVKDLRFLAVDYCRLNGLMDRLRDKRVIAGAVPLERSQSLDEDYLKVEAKPPFVDRTMEEKLEIFKGIPFSPQEKKVLINILEGHDSWDGAKLIKISLVNYQQARFNICKRAKKYLAKKQQMSY